MNEENKDEIVKQRMQKIGKCVDGLLPIGYGFDADTRIHTS